jgi:hypothetical protein
MHTNHAKTSATGMPARTPLHTRIASVLAVLLLSIATWPFLKDLRLPLVPIESNGETKDVHDIRDFAQDWASARNLLEGHPVYRDQGEALEEYLGLRPDKSNPAYRFVLKYNAHPPSSVLLVVPLASMDYADAFLAWNLISLALLAVCIFVIVRQLHLRVTVLGLLVGWTLLIFCNPFRHQMTQGQLNMVLLALIVGGWALERSDRPVLAGVLLGLAAAIKLFPAFLLVYYAVLGRWRLVFGGVAAVVLATGLSLMALGRETYWVYYHDVVPHVATYRDWWVNASLPGLWNKLFLADSGHVVPLARSPGIYWSMLIVSGILVGGVLLYAVRSAGTRQEHDLTFSLAVIGMLLAGPITWDHGLVLLLVPILVLGTEMRCLGNWSWLYILSVAALWLAAPKFVFDHTIGGPGEYRGQVASAKQVLGVISYLCYGLLGLFTVSVVALERERRARLRMLIQGSQISQ